MTSLVPNKLVVNLIVFTLVIVHQPGSVDGIYDTQGPNFISEPPARMDFTNSNGGVADCVARGNPEPVVEWVAADGSAIAVIPGVRMPLSNGSLYFPPFQAEAYRQDVHAAVYRCIASNAVGAILSRDLTVRAVVNQHYEPEVQNPGGIVGNTVIMRCTVPAFVKDFVTVTSWLQEPAFNIYPSTVSDGKYHMLPSGELLINDVTRVDAMKGYRCRTHHQLTQESVVSINVGRIQLTEIRGLVPPILYEKLVSLSARLDETVVVPCVAYANPRPSYRWFYRRQQQHVAVEESGRLMVREGTLVIPNVKQSDAGSYFCNASNEQGSEVMEVRLVVTAQLAVSLQPARLTADLGRAAELTCAVTGFPHGAPHWFKDGQPLRTGARVRLSSPERLHLAAVAKEDRGMYQCVVRSEHEMAHAVAELRLGEVYPQLVYRFIEQTLQPGPSVSLKCSASGNPTPQISWTLDGFPLPHSSDRLLIGQYVSVFGDVISHVNISSVRAEDGGEYACLAENRAGTDRHAARLNIYGLPYVRPMPSIPAVAGKRLLIKCPVAGYPIDTVVWEKDGVRLPTNIRQKVTNGSLTVENVQRGLDQGSYTCVARNKQNHSSQRAVEVRVLVPPKITPFSFGRDLNVGERTSIQCVVVTGDLPLTFTWLKDNIGLSGAGAEVLRDISIRQYDDFTSALSIGSIARTHGGNFTCRVGNDAATVTHTSQLHVNVPPRISPFYFEEAGVSEGMRTQLMCTTSQGDQPFNITWLKDNVAISGMTSSWIDISQYSPFSSILAISSVTSSHSGNYTCVVENRAGKVQYTATLSVTVPPRWLVEPTDQTVILGKPVVLQCQVDGFPKPSITWKQAIGNQPGDYREIGYRSQRLRVMENGSLVISRASEENEGYFLCQASNGIGAGLSKVIHLNVHAAPRFKQEVRPAETVRKGDTVHLRCEAEGDNPMDINWSVRGVRIDPTFDNRFSIKNTPAHGGTGGAVSELSIVEATHRDRGEYVCVASNAFGQDQLSTQLLVQEPPNFPRNLHVAEQTSRSIVLAWASATDGNIPITNYVLQFKEANDVWHDHNAQKVVSGEKTVVTVEGLKPATMYQFRLYAENQLGTSAPSDVLHGMTSGEKPAGPPVQVAAEAVSSTQLRVTWQPPDRELWNGEILGYNVGYKKYSQGLQEMGYNMTRVSLTGDMPGDFRLGSLEKFTKYSVVVQAFNNIGDGPRSDPLTALTLEDVPSSSPQDVQCSSLTSQSLQVSWQPPPLSRAHGLIQGYKIFYEPAEEWHDTLISSESKVTSALTSVLHGLQHFTNYSVQLLAFTRAGDGVRSPPVFCKTEETVPESPERVKASASSTTAVVISWLPPRRPNGVITKYTVHVRTLEGSSKDAGKVSKWTLTPQQLQYTAQDLKKRESYEAWVTASTKVGQGPSTPVVQLFPSSVVPAAIVSFGQVVTVPWKVDVRLSCQVVGVPRPSVEWKKSDMKVQKDSRMVVTSDNTLLIQNVQRSHEGNYSCHARNNLGSDQITYALHVQVPPTLPILLATAVTASTVQLQWKQGDNGGSPVRGFLLSFRREGGGAEWEDVTVDRRLTTHLLDGLQCGSQYHFRLTAFNKIGSGAASKPESARTSGSRPVAPSKSQFLQVNTSAVTLYLNTWSDGGCPILFFTVDFKRPGGDWHTVSSSVPPQPRYQVEGLDPDSRYLLRVTAHNNAGHTVAEFDFSTLHQYGGVSSSHDMVRPVEEEGSSGVLEAHVLVPLLITATALVVALGGVCYCVRRKSAPESLQDSQASAALDNKQNMEQRELQYYATVRKPMPSPIRDISTLERIPEYSEDIYPYATFHLPEQENMAANPQLQALLYTEQHSAETLQMKQVRSRSGRRRRSKCKSFKSESEEYDTLGSEDLDLSEGESPTESSNQLLQDRGDPAPPPPAQRHPPSRVHHNFLYHTHESSTSTEPSPISERKSFPRHGKHRSHHRATRMTETADPRGEEGRSMVLGPGRKLEPPSGFSDATLEMSEAECDIDSIKKMRGFNFLCSPSRRSNQDYTIAV